MTEMEHAIQMGMTIILQLRSQEYPDDDSNGSCDLMDSLMTAGITIFFGWLAGVLASAYLPALVISL